MSEPKRIGMLSEPVPDYVKELGAVETLEELRTMLEGWRKLAGDAREAAQQIKPEEWPEFMRGLRAERAGRFAGEPWAERWTVLLMPTMLWRVSMVAEHFHVPWGVAYTRLKDTGQLK